LITPNEGMPESKSIRADIGYERCCLNTTGSLTLIIAVWLALTLMTNPLFGGEEASFPTELSLKPGYVGGNDYAARCSALIQWYASNTPQQPTFAKDAMPYYTARLLTDKQTESVFVALDKMADAAMQGRPDPFNLHAMMHGYCICPDKYPSVLRDKFKRFAASWDYTKPIGVSLNYELMRDGAGWLAAQEFPDLSDKAGNDAAKIKALCANRLLKTLQETAARNSSEYESPLYTGTDLMAIRMLAEFAEDRQIRTAAQMTLEWMLIQTAAHWHRGYFITSSGRAKYWGSNNLSPDNVGATTGMAYLLLGGDRAQRLSGCPQCFWLAHPGQAIPADWLAAWYHALPVPRTVQASLIWPSHRIYVRKTAWITENYGLASERSDGTAPDSYHYKESRRTMLKWVSDKPCSTFTLLQENRRRPQEKTANAFAYGENPYGQVLQYENTLIGVYDVPEEYGFWKMQAPFTRDGAIVQRVEKEGWIFCHAGSMLFAFRSVCPVQWGPTNVRENLDVLECSQRRNAWILETSSLNPYAGGGVETELRRFAAAVLTKTKIESILNEGPPRLVFKNLSGHTLDLTWHALSDPYADHCLIDKIPVNYSAYPLLSAPQVKQDVGGSMEIDLLGKGVRIYDFKKWKLTTKMR
jgi:hypothetical protein